ncbi:uncharacterized protein LOC100254480 [Vitis vinifera]|uniref:RING-type domain-containing protein n=2 Tax=Vitis vinifera TaxID=29760 RepID=F6HYY8_VITVI|nr:uncharacterized protein LOC100254480 [Vitis vinifera]|eukprot:XP_002280880.3 PREDICTED: uncharacterized protein LOC100254480 [Vitis vinifera]
MEGLKLTGTMMNQSKDTSCNDSPSEGPNPCPICLGPVVKDSYLDQCFHKFCYDCIVRWTKVVASKHCRLSSTIKCPFCKTENFSIVHGYDGSSFQQHYINQDFGKSFSFSKAHKYRLQCYYTEPGILNDKFNVSRYWKFHKYRQPNQWLQAWLRREIQALIQEEDVDIIVHHILGVLDSVIKRTEQKGQTITPERKQEEFKASVSDAARPFLTGRTDRFVNEVELFLASGLNIEAYDEVYLQQLGWTNPMATTEGVEEQNGHTHVVPYLYLFDYDSDGTD